MSDTATQLRDNVRKILVAIVNEDHDDYDTLKSVFEDHGMSDTATQLRDNVRKTAADLEILVAIANEDHDDYDTLKSVFEDHGYEPPALEDDEYDTSEAAETAREILDEWPLEFVEYGKRNPGGEWETTHVVVVFGTGGPHIELDTSKKAVMGYWGGDVARASVDDYVIDYFEGIWG